MPFDIHFGEYPRDAATRVDHDSRPLDSHVGYSEVLLLLPDPVRIGQAMLGIDEQPVRKRVFLPELPVGFRAIRTHPENLCVHFPEPGKGVAKIARLTRSAGGVVPGIEKKNHVPSGERLKRNSAAVVSLQIEIRCLVAFPELRHERKSYAQNAPVAVDISESCRSPPISCS